MKIENKKSKDQKNCFNIKFFIYFLLLLYSYVLTAFNKFLKFFFLYSKEKGKYRKYNVRVIINQEMYFENGTKVIVLNFSEVSAGAANAVLKTDDINLEESPFQANSPGWVREKTWTNVKLMSVQIQDGNI